MQRGRVGGRDAHDGDAREPWVLFEVLKEGRRDVPSAMARVDDELRHPSHGIWHGE